MTATQRIQQIREVASYHEKEFLPADPLRDQLFVDDRLILLRAMDAYKEIAIDLYFAYTHHTKENSQKNIDRLFEEKMNEQRT